MERIKKEHPHGTRARYVGMKCRCEACRKANRDYYHVRQRAAKAALEELGPPASPGVQPREWTAPDGTRRLRLYRRACPGVGGEPCATKAFLRKDSVGGVCNVCRLKVIANPLVPTDRVRAHLQALSAQGVGYKTVADVARVPPSILNGILAGQKKKMRQQSEKRVLAVDASARADGSLVPAREAKRLVRELKKKGYSQAEIARRLGGEESTPALQWLNRPSITAKKEMKLKRVYREILEEVQIVRELEDVCDVCQQVHTPETRLRILRRALPLEPRALREAWPCIWDPTEAGERLLYRDLHALGAKKIPGSFAWSIPTSSGLGH